MACSTGKSPLSTLPGPLTVDLVRVSNGTVWHIAAGDSTRCSRPIPTSAVREDSLDSRVVSHRGRIVCARCRKASQ